MKHLLGIPDEEFFRGKVPMTKEEIRIVTLAKAKLRPFMNVLDIGAGTGSLSIEAALLAYEGQVFAIERNSEGIELIKKNAAKFGVNNLIVLEGEAPAKMSGLPVCDVVFIGGSGSKLTDILLAADKLLKPGGRMIITSVTVETLYKAAEYMKAAPDYTYDIVQLQASRYRPVGSYHLAQAMNPVSIITGIKSL